MGIRISDGLKHLGMWFLHLFKEHPWLIGFLIILAFLAYFISEAVNEILAAKEETDTRPREDMFWCPIHGPVRKKHCINLFEGMKKRNGEDFLACPVCYKENVYDRVDANARKANG